MGAVIAEYLGDNGRFITGLNRHLILSAWDKASGAGRYTVSRHFKNGSLYVTVSSSVLRTQLNFQKEDIRRQINRILSEDELFSGKNEGGETVKTLIIK